ncbi:MAG: hypothetical protein R6T85_08595 [Egibacteraceae bacterium]
MTGIVGVDDDLDPLTPGLPRATSDDHIPAMQRLAEAVHAGGAKLAVQLTAPSTSTATPATSSTSS